MAYGPQEPSWGALVPARLCCAAVRMPIRGWRHPTRACSAGVGQRPRRRADPVSTVGQSPGIPRLLLGRLARGAGNIPNLTRVHAPPPADPPWRARVSPHAPDRPWLRAP